MKRLAATLAVVCLALAGCTGVPSSSAPAVVTTVVAQQPPSPQKPEPGADPRTIVSDFLQNNAASDVHHQAARQFLTAEASAGWADTTALIVDDMTIFIPNAQHQVTVTGDPIGKIDANGIYTPQQTEGGGGAPASVTYTLRQVRGQWRIDNVQPGGVGLLITPAQFRTYYAQHALYFYDLGETRLVPDPRWTALRGPDLATWLVGQLAQGARPELQPAIRPELPQQSDPRRVTATESDDVTKVEIPGANQLPDAWKARLAAQVALTVSPAVPGADLSITDGGRPVQIPQVRSAVFSAASLSSLLPTDKPPPALYYVDSEGAVIDADTDQPIAGPLGSAAQYKLASVGLASLSRTSTDRLLAAGTVGAPGAQTFYVGTTSDGLHQVQRVSGALSRPAWVPNSSEVWIGAGSTLYRVPTSGPLAGVASPVQLSTGTDKVDSPIAALRFSPEGVRVAIVLKNEHGDGQIWLGTVVRASNSVQVNNLKLISPAGVSITDVAWNDSLKLFAVGRNVGGGASVYELQSDGSLWTQNGISNLPGEPDSITVSSGLRAAVSVSSSIWVQNASSWDSPSAGTTPGTSPIYVE